MRAKHGGPYTPVKHGGRYTPEYRVWLNMRQRCENPNHKYWADYGGRGITVCKEWGDFARFMADMGPRPDGLTLDRYPNKDGNYEPGNCRWASWTEQQNNRRSNKIVRFEGERLTVSQVAQKAGVRVGLLYQRLNRGWSVERAVQL